MSRTRFRLKPLLLLSSLCLASVPGFGQEIPFVGRNDATLRRCIHCFGPWFRNGFSSPILPGSVSEFYRATVNLFSPFGLWVCDRSPLYLDGSCNFNQSAVEASTRFCLRPGDARVNLTLTAQGGITVDKPASPCNSAAAVGFLEDDGRHSEAGYQFAGEAGETVSVTLDRDGAQGSTGKVVQLSLGSQHGAALTQQQGAVPVEITATLPTSGIYVVQATETPEAAAGAGSAFRGYYLLRVTAASGEEVELEPLPSTQP